MKCFKYLIFCIILLVSCNATEDKKAQVFKDFLRYYRANILKEGKGLMVLKEPMESRKYDDMWNTLAIDTLRAKQFSALAIKKWDSTYFKDAKFFSSIELNQLRYDIELQRKFYDEHQGFYSLSQPYISKNGGYVLMAIYYVCGDRCGYGKLQLFKAHQKTWVLVNTYVDSIS